MTRPTVQKTIDDLKAERETIADQLRVLGIRDAQLKQAIATLEALEADEPLEFEGKLTDAIRQVLRSSARALTPKEVRTELNAIGYNLKRHGNPMAAIHSVLKRMVTSKDVKAIGTSKGATYLWSPPAPSPGTMGELMYSTPSEWTTRVFDPNALTISGAYKADSLVTSIGSKYRSVFEMTDLVSDVLSKATVTGLLKK